MERPRSIESIMAAITPTQYHAISRCSDAEDWARRGYGFCREWGDLIAGRRGCQFRSVRALVAMGVMYEHSMGRRYGLTPLGLTIQLRARNPEPARRVGGVG